MKQDFDCLKRASRIAKIWRIELLQWYEINGRKNLPWRNLGRNLGHKFEDNLEPNVAQKAYADNLSQAFQNLGHFLKTITPEYGVYVSEIMLQQTQVGRVLEHYYFPFLEAFPTLEALACASEAEVLKRWEGLGYYTRARNLYKSAQICLEKYGGRLPSTREELLALPGIGSYSAGAILCFGFGQSVSFVDGNIRRVLSRIFALSEPKMRELEALAQILLSTYNSFDYNQALLDVGATICTPNSPLCQSCPVSKLCLGKANPKLYPKSKSRTLIPLALKLVYCVDLNGHIALCQSKEKLYHGLYNLPMSSSLDSEISESRLLLRGSFTHRYTKYAINAQVYELEYGHNLWSARENIEFLSLKDIACKPLSSLCQKALKLCGVRLISESNRA